MNVLLKDIEQDTSIQCRAKIDQSVVNDYANRMGEGDKFPDVILFGTKEKCWIGDGWHRVKAAQAIGAVDIPAQLHEGGRTEALKHALSANATHGNRRSNEDKARCVVIALAEFGKLSDAAIAQMCGVDDKTVAGRRPARFGISEPEKRIGKDGKKYPAKKTKAATQSAIMKHTMEVIGEALGDMCGDDEPEATADPETTQPAETAPADVQVVEKSEPAVVAEVTPIKPTSGNERPKWCKYVVTATFWLMTKTDIERLEKKPGFHSIDHIEDLRLTKPKDDKTSEV